jgi:hypothetical protein
MKTMTKSIGIFCLALGLAGHATILRASEEKLAADLKSRNLAANVEVIVQYKVSPTEAHHQRVASLGGKLNAKMDFIKGAHYTVPQSSLQTLANDPDVAYITPNRAIKPTFDQIDVEAAESTTAPPGSYSVRRTWYGVSMWSGAQTSSGARMPFSRIMLYGVRMSSGVPIPWRASMWSTNDASESDSLAINGEQ